MHEYRITHQAARLGLEPDVTVKIVRYYPRALRGDGGITNSVRHLSNACVRAGANVTVAVDEIDAPPSDENAYAFAWACVAHRGPSSFRSPKGLSPLLEEADLLVLHSAWTYHNAVAARTARRLGVPYVLEPRGAYDPRILARRRALKSAWWWAIERRLVREAAAVHVFFASQRDHLGRIGYVGPVIVAPNGISPRAGFTWDGGSGGYVLWIGRFDPEHKGVDLLVEGLRRLPPDRRPHLRLHGPDWVGGKAKVVSLVDRLGLGEYVTLGGPVYGDEKWRLLSQALAFAYPSRWEGFGNSAAEAVSIGVPTLVTPYPLGLWLGERRAAIVVDPTPEGLATGLERVVAPDAGETGRRGREAARDALDWDAVARSWLEQAEALC